MLSGGRLIGFGVGGQAARIAYVSVFEDATDASSYTATAQAIGTAAADRVVLVGVVSRQSGSVPSISSVTIGGNAAASIVSTTHATDFSISAIYGLLVTSGTTANIVVTFGAAQQRCAIVVFEMNGTGGSATAFATATDNAAPSSTTLSIPSGGAAMGVSFARATAAVGSATWTGMTEAVEDTSLENTSNAYTAGYYTEFGGGTPTIGVTWSGGTPDGSEVFVAASFAPA